jgi:hypothetical protein
MTTKILESEYLICELDDTIPVFKHRWLRNPEPEEFLYGLTSMQKEYLKVKDDYEDLKWLADTQQLEELDPETKEWLNADWDQMLFVEAGVKTHAVVRGPDLYADYPMEIFKLVAAKKYHELGVKLEVFEDEAQAYEWMSK